jgi:hypothetical protein
MTVMKNLEAGLRKATEQAKKDKDNRDYFRKEYERYQKAYEKSSEDVAQFESALNIHEKYEQTVSEAGQLAKKESTWGI